MTRSAMKLLLVFTLPFSWSQSSLAQNYLMLNDIKPPQQASEYIFRTDLKENLITVQLLGAIAKPGIYYIPPSTDLLKLLTLAGGTNNVGDLSEVLIRKKTPDEWDGIPSQHIEKMKSGIYEINVVELLKTGGSDTLSLANNDFVFVPQNASWISNNASRTLTVVSVVLGIVLTGVLIDKNTGSN